MPTLSGGVNFSMELSDFRDSVLQEIRDLFRDHEGRMESLLKPPKLKRKKTKDVRNESRTSGFLSVEDEKMEKTPVHPFSMWAETPAGQNDSSLQDSGEKADQNLHPVAPAPSDSRISSAFKKLSFFGQRDEPLPDAFDINHEHIKIRKAGFYDDPNKADIKLDEDLYRVENFYKTTGCAQAIARSEQFERFTLFMICVNTVYIGVDADRNTEPTLITAHLAFQLCDNLFCVFFTFELMVRFTAFAQKRNCLRDKWFVFDSMLVTMMVAETWILTCVLLVIKGGGIQLPTGALRLLRLARLTRLVRLLRSLPELLTLVNGMKAAARAVISSLMFIVMLNYIFAIVIHMFLGDIYEVDTLFGTLGLSMWTLILDGTFMDGTKAVLDELRALESHGHSWITGWSMIGFFLLYVLLTNVTVMNMLIGVLCEVVSQVKKTDEEKVAIDFMKRFLRDMLKSLDVDGNNQISKEELAQVVHIPSAIEVLDQLEVNPKYVMEMTEELFEEDAAAGRVQEVTREELMEVILKIRGNREVTMQDIVEARCDLRRVVARRTDEVLEHIADLKRSLILME